MITKLVQFEIFKVSPLWLGHQLSSPWRSQLKIGMRILLGVLKQVRNISNVTSVQVTWLKMLVSAVVVLMLGADCNAPCRERIRGFIHSSNSPRYVDQQRASATCRGTRVKKRCPALATLHCIACEVQRHALALHVKLCSALRYTWSTNNT